MNRLSDMTWPELAAAIARGSTTVILPLGATEQHGPHLPLGTDTLLHAGEGETSQLLHVCPDLVRLDRAEPGFVGDMEQIVPALRAVGLQPVTPNGVLGDPSRAQADRGARYLDALADRLATELRVEF